MSVAGIYLVSKEDVLPVAGTVKTVSGRRVGANFVEIIPDKV